MSFILDYIKCLFARLNFCSGESRELKFKIKINQKGMLEEIFIKFPNTNRYFIDVDFTQDQNSYYVNEILTTYFIKDGNKYYTTNHLYETLSSKFGKEPSWYELNTEWIKFIFPDLILDNS